MGFLSRKKPKPAPVEVQEEHQMVDELQEMERAVPARDEGDWPAGPVDAGDPPPAAEQQEVPPATPPAGEELISEAQPSEVVDEVGPSEMEVEDEAPLNAEELEEPADDGRMKAIDLIAPT